MAFQIQGELHEKFDTQVISDKFKKREFILKIVDENRFNQLIKFELKFDRCELINTIEKGEKITVDFNLNGRDWRNPEGKIIYFTTLDAFRVTTLETKDKTELTIDSTPSTLPPPNEVIQELKKGDGDDLPF